MFLEDHSREGIIHGKNHVWGHVSVLGKIFFLDHAGVSLPGKIMTVDQVMFLMKIIFGDHGTLPAED
jgi:hypothetical protein